MEEADSSEYSLFTGHKSLQYAGELVEKASILYCIICMGYSKGKSERCRSINYNSFFERRAGCPVDDRVGKDGVNNINE